MASLMDNISQKKGNIVRKFCLQLGVEIIVCMIVMAVAGTFMVHSVQTRNYETSINELLTANVQGLAYRNSKFMQQLRMYTMSDVVRSGGSTEEIASWLVAHKNIRASEFNQIIYVDVETGMGYWDDGSVKDVSNKEYFKKIVDGQLSQYISDPEGTSKDDGQYYVIKCMKDGKTKMVYGFFVGGVSLKTLADAVVNIKTGENGFALMLAGDGNVMGFHEESLIMSANFLSGKKISGYEGYADLAKKMATGEPGTSWTSINGKKQLAVYKPVSGTPWYIALLCPNDQVYEVESSMKKILFPLIVMTFVLLIGLSAISIMSLLRPLQAVDKKVNEMASGNADLTQRLRIVSDDEIGSVTVGINNFIGKLHSIMRDVQDANKTLLSSGDELQSVIKNTSDSLDSVVQHIDSVKSQLGNQVSSVDDTASAVNEIASNIASLERMIEMQSSGVAQASSSVEEMISNISSVNLSVDKMADEFAKLEEKARVGNDMQHQMSERIAQIEDQSEMLQTANLAISNIAKQTNLLAMNAAIEAAHAGVAGQGFSVVAEEIRKLSETASSQSRTIGEQLKNIKGAINDVVGTAGATTQTFAELVQSVHSTDELVRNIKEAMDEQQQGSRQISEALKNMSSSTSEVRSSSSEMAAGNKSVLLDVKKLKDSTQDMESSVDQMAARTRQISQISIALESIAGKMASSIDSIGQEINSFKV